MAEVTERIRADGGVETQLDTAAARAVLHAARADGIDSVAVVFMHAYAHPKHEKIAAALAREAGFAQISVSHEVSPRVCSRGRTPSCPDPLVAWWGRSRPRGWRASRA